MKFVRFGMGQQSQVQLLNQYCATAIAIKPTINDQRASVFQNLTSCVENIFSLVIERKARLVLKKPPNHQKFPLIM